MGRVKNAGAGDIFQGVGSSCAFIWVVYMGNDPLHGAGPGGFPEQDGPADHGNISVAASGRQLGVSSLV